MRHLVSPIHTALCQIHAKVMVIAEYRLHLWVACAMHAQRATTENRAHSAYESHGSCWPETRSSPDSPPRLYSWSNACRVVAGSSSPPAPMTYCASMREARAHCLKMRDRGLSLSNAMGFPSFLRPSPSCSGPNSPYVPARLSGIVFATYQ
jgi:hypothetical protein